jgi:aminopeptidase-like protein
MKSELDQHLFSLPDSPDAIPYVTSYYELGWGFCVSEKDRHKFGEGPFHVFIDSDLAPGHMTYAELLIPGLIEDEILLSTYVCHPSMANNELSGPAVLAKISQLLLADSAPKYSYRILFLVETIGSLHYISENLASLKENVKAGFVLTCIGDDRVFSYVPTRAGNTLSDRVARKVFKSYGSFGIEYTWFDRGSDERQFNAPGIDLPIASLMRTKYGQYPEYHTSLDDLSVISPAGLLGGLNMVWDVIRILERNANFKINVLGEPQLGRRGLYPNTSIKTIYDTVQNQMNVISCLDGSRDLIEISEMCGLDFESVWSIICDLIEANLVEFFNL